jgi:hypothetical protein
MRSKSTPVPGDEQLLHDLFANVFAACREEEMPTPFTIHITAANGTVMVLSADDDGDGGYCIQTICERIEHPGVAFPAMIGIVEPITGQARLVRLGTTGKMSWQS